VVRIAITQAAFDAVASTLPRGSVGYENEANARRAPCLVGGTVADRFRAMRGPGESDSDVIFRLVEAGAGAPVMARK
jgi:hypothetical protein